MPEAVILVNIFHEVELGSPLGIMAKRFYSGQDGSEFELEARFIFTGKGLKPLPYFTKLIKLYIYIYIYI